MANQPIKVAVIGVGHLGQHHARIYHEMEETELVGVADANPERAAEIAGRLGVRGVTDYRDLFDEAEAVNVAVPTTHHFRIARECLEAGLHVLVEKPMTRTVAEGEQLVALAAEQECLLQVGHIERFNPAISALSKQIKEPRYLFCERISPFSFRSADIGVVLDLMIHDLDIVLHLMGYAELERVEALGLNVLSDAEDLANARLQFRNGCTADLTASRLSFKQSRKMRLFQPHAYMSVDYHAQRAFVVSKKPGWSMGELTPEELARIGEEGAGLGAFEVFARYLDFQELDFGTPEGPLRAELQAFAHAIRHREAPVVTGQQALTALRVAHQITDAIKERVAEERERFGA